MERARTAAKNAVDALNRLGSCFRGLTDAEMMQAAQPFAAALGSGWDAWGREERGNAAMALIAAVVGDGQLVHSNRASEWTTGCPACGCTSWIVWLSAMRDARKKCRISKVDDGAMDVFECVACGAFSTRYDHQGPAGWAEWQLLRKRAYQ